MQRGGQEALRFTNRQPGPHIRSGVGELCSKEDFCLHATSGHRCVLPDRLRHAWRLLGPHVVLICPEWPSIEPTAIPSHHKGGSFPIYLHMPVHLQARK